MSNWFSEPMENEVPFSEIEAKSGSFHKWNFEPLTMQEIGYEGVNDKLREYTAERYEALDDEGKERLVKEVLDIYRSVNLLPIQYYSEIGVMNEIEKCINYKAGFTGNTVSCVSGDTEYFNGENWVRIDSYKDGDMVLQFNPDGTAELVDPIKYIHTKNNDKFYVVGENGCLMVLTGNHDVVFVDDSTNELTKLSVDEIIRSMRGDLAVLKVPVCCEMKDNGYSLDVQTNMIAWIINGIITGNESDCEFLQRLPNGAICFTDKIFRLNRSSRKQMLSMLGIDRCYSMDMFSEELAKQVVTLYNMTYFGNIKEVTYPANHAMPYNAFHGSLIGDDNMYERRVVISGGDEIVGMDDPGFIRSCCRLYDFNNGRYRVLNGEEKGYDFSFTDKYCFEVPSHMLVLRRKGYMFVTGNCGAGVGTTLCNYLFPNLFDVPSKHDLDKKDAETLFKKFHNDAYLSRAIKFCFSYKNGCPTPTNVMGGLRLVGSAPTNFRPMNAKAVYERFCPEGGTVYDFCCVDDETEFFNGTEWKSLADYKEGDKVLQYNEDGTANLVNPIEYIHYQSNAPFYEYNSDDISSCQTGNHDVVYLSEGKVCKVKQEDILNTTITGIPTSCIYDGSLDLPEEVLYSTIMRVEDCEEDYPESFLCLSLKCKKLFMEYLLSMSDDVIKEASDCYIYSHKEENVYIVNSIATTSGYKTSMFRGEDLTIYKKDASFCYNGGNYAEVNKRDKYCFVVPSHMLVLRRKGRVYITGNCGFGGRLLGCLSSKKNFRYVGTDPCVETMYHLHELGDYIEMVTGRDDSYELHCCGSEDFCGQAESVDFAFSSPPYFDLEVYSTDETQCFNKFPELDQWLEGYVRATIKNIKYMLRRGCVYAVNIADFTVGGGNTVAYVDEWIRISTEEGMPLYDTVYLGVTARAGSAQQAAGELKKENILIFKKPL